MIKKRKFIYLAGKLSGNRIWNFLVARKYYKQILKNGDLVYSPHFASMFVGNTLNYSEWIDNCFGIILKCDEVYVIPGWETSYGTKLEILFATRHNKPIIYL